MEIQAARGIIWRPMYESNFILNVSSAISDNYLARTFLSSDEQTKPLCPLPILVYRHDVSSSLCYSLQRIGSLARLTDDFHPEAQCLELCMVKHVSPIEDVPGLPHPLSNASPVQTTRACCRIHGFHIG